MSRYRKIEVRTWSDERFRGLSAMPPSGQGLWFFLLTGPHTSPIPGLFRAGRAAMAEELGWEQEAFDEAFQEVSAKGMAKADFKAKLIWLPNALKHNKPESPNVVKSWRKEVILLPECALRNEAIAALRAYLETIGEPYLAAFDEPIDDPSAKPKPKPSSKPSTKAMANQEQEQEQEEKPSSSAAPDDPGRMVDLQPAIAERLAQVTDEAITAFNGSALVKGSTAGGLLARVSATVGREKRQQQVRRCLRTARAIAKELFGSEKITPEFWRQYWAEVAQDDFLAGRGKPGKGHENWLPDFEFLVREETMLKVYDRAAVEGAA